MPFGLTKASAIFQLLFDTLIEPKMEPDVFIYLDDIIIVTDIFEDHRNWLSIVLKKIKDANLNLNAAKCKFCCSPVKYLGYMVDNNGLLVDPDKVSSVLEYPVRENVKELRRFLGMSTWHRKYIHNFARITDPLNLLLKKKQNWCWSEKQLSAFELMKSHSIRPLFCPALILMKPSSCRLMPVVQALVQS